MDLRVKVVLHTSWTLESRWSPRPGGPLPPPSTLRCVSSAGHNEGTISVAEGELLFVIEEDKGDGWTRVRRNEDEEGYVPSSYVEVFLESNAKGAMTYI